ncbi:MAG: SUMF1/EgtB/PvdO family nonheme iron enzyme, partial [Gammaproteobacteria bacterium]|nr:SUMF1/EgtB/PvdO family nonheme iron enzyme [Gammaproteobacteria bacterium]
MIQNLAKSQKHRLVELLLACPSMQNKENRDILLQELPLHIASAISSNSVAKTHVLSIVNTCVRDQDGLGALLEALRFFDGKTRQYNEVIGFLKGEKAEIPPKKELVALSKELGVRQTALENFFEILGKSAVPLKNLDSELREVARKHKEFISRDLELVIERSNLSAKIKAKDEFTQHSEDSRQLIKKAQHKLRYLPSHPDYIKVMLMGGTVLSSAGNLKEAKELLLKALKISKTEEDRGLICFNLFQINIRCRDYRKALENLQEAIKINPGKYALHNVKKYPIERLLGAGGMGVVFLCSYPLKKKKVAVKCLWEKREGADKEAEIMQEAAGKYVPEVIDHDYSGSERAYFVTEYVEGAIDGATWLKKHGKLSLEEGLEVGAQIAEALQSAHEKGIFHLDLKPANILLKRSADSGIEVKIIDFGLSKLANSLQEEAVARQTELGLSVFGRGIMGTLEYAPPEQLGYGGEPDAKSDVFSFGTTLYHLLTGESPRFPDHRNLPDVRELQYLVLDCVKLEPEKRLDIREIMLRLGKIAESLPKAKVQKTDKKPGALKPPAGEVKAAEVSRDFLKEGETLIPAHSLDSRVRGNDGREVSPVKQEARKRSQCPEMVRLPPGTFRMGDSQGAGYDWEKPVHEVTLDSFSVACFPVTFAEYDLFCEAAGRKKPEDKGWGRDKRPVINVSWEDAVAYCEWLSAQTQEEYRLLTEAEWEYACRAGSETAYFFGDDEKRFGDYAWYSENSGGKTHPTGEKKPNAWGLYDMHGNAWEWVHDCYGYYPKEAQRNPTGPETGSSRVVRGSSWTGPARYCRSALRSRGDPGVRDDFLGFRLARTDPQPSYPFTLDGNSRTDSEIGGKREEKSSAAKDAGMPGNGSAPKKSLRKPVFIVVFLFAIVILTWLAVNSPQVRIQEPEMIRISGGTFRMGDIQGKSADDKKPGREVTLGEFFIGKYEVKKGEFRQFVQDAKYKMDAEKAEGCW